MRARRVGLGLLVAALLLVAVPVAAHQSAPTLVPVVDGLTPDVSGVTVTVQASQDATLLALEVDGGRSVEVLDADGGAWARIAADRVEVDVTSPAFHAATNANGLVPDPLPSPAEPWVVVGRDGRFQWFEHRLHPADLDVPADVLASERAQDVATWRVPLRVDGVDAEVTGRLRHVPVTGRVEARLRTPREFAPGVTVEVASGPVPVVFLRNDGDVPVTVLGRDGAPYVVLDGDGAAVNTASSTWAEQRRLEGTAPPQPEAPAFVPVSATPSHSWLETRGALPGVLPDEDVRAAGREVELFTWSVPVEVGDELVALEGVTVWVPLDAGSTDESARGLPAEWLVAAAVALVLVALVVRRRRAG